MPFDLFGGGRKRRDERERVMTRLEEEREEHLKIKAELKEQGIDLDAPEEDLGCPRCGATYTYGDTCPECLVPLVGLSSLELARSAPPPTRDIGWILALVTGLLVAGAGCALWFLTG